MRFKAIDIVVIALTVLLLSVAYVSAVPGGADSIVVGDTERYQPTASGTPVEAMAGNVTALTISGRSVTRFWQGYFGNITGTIVLSDATNNTLYEWTLADPAGEIYATRVQTIDWTNNIVCANDSVITSEDNYLHVNQTSDGDTVNKTFVRTDHPSFYVGGNSFAQTGCKTASINHSGTGYGYYEVLLQDNTTMDIIYTAIVPTGNYTGFDGGLHDFQMMVGENGTGAEEFPNGITTTYYFFVELG